jgi:hypothetical protein
MPILSSVQASVDGQIASLMTSLAVQQTTYKAAHGKFFQGLTTASDATLPNNTDAGTLQTVPQVLTATPTDQSENWNQIGIIIPGTLSCSMTVDNYGGPQGQGWVMTTRFQHTGHIFSKSTNSGPETYRNSAWTQVT